MTSFIRSYFEATLEKTCFTLDAFSSSLTVSKPKCVFLSVDDEQSCLRGKPFKIPALSHPVNNDRQLINLKHGWNITKSKCGYGFSRTLNVFTKQSSAKQGKKLLLSTGLTLTLSKKDVALFSQQTVTSEAKKSSLYTLLFFACFCLPHFDLIGCLM